MIEFQFAKGKPEYLQIAEQLEVAVAAGRLKPRERLEPVRELAARLALNPSTVARAYRLLERQGVISTGGRRGSRVAEPSGGGQLLRQMRLRALVARAVCEGLAQGFAPDELEAGLGLELAAWRERRTPAAAQAGRESEPGHGRLARFAGSHDLALEALWAQARREHPGLVLEPRYVGSLDGLLALLHGEVGLAGAHLLDEESGEYNRPILRRLFIGIPLCLVTLAEREQGLILPRGNPRRIGGLAELARPGLRFVNRQPGSGTRALLDHSLRLAAVGPAEIRGYERVVPTHLAVAAAVADGSADAGLGIRAAARAFDLDFLPLARERYDLVLYAADRDSAPIAELLGVLASAQFHAVVGQIGGYDTARTGQEQRL